MLEMFCPVFVVEINVFVDPSIPIIELIPAK